MKVKCTSTSFWPDSYEHRDMSDHITLGKIYEVLPNPVSQWVYNIIDDSGNPHDISKDCFTELRQINLDKLLK